MAKTLPKPPAKPAPKVESESHAYDWRKMNNLKRGNAKPGC